jgi:peptidoglycan/xylan/chitin deacetylase (PgdA/CDA1 family)
MVLDMLKAHDAKASFFCIGNNVEKYPEVYARIIEEGHTVGNHTQNHLNGWKTGDEKYFNNIKTASHWIDSKLFRPPYGRMTRFQEKLISKKPLQFKTIMWTILSGDFDMELDWNDCYKNIERNLCKGAIIVFHDSEKAEKRMIQALEQTLKKGKKDGWVFESLPKM